jgi:two-component system, OmpR family, phosphate regulon response regulator PhoB
MTPITHLTEEVIHVLFIEDDPSVAEMYKLKLELDGYQVKVVPNDDRVVQEAASLRPDMIYLDLRFGEEEGFATLQRLRATGRTRGVPVIILSRQPASELAGRGFEAELLDYVVRADPGPHGLSGNLEDWARAGSA